MPSDLRLFVLLWVVLAFFVDPLVDTVTQRYLLPSIAIVEEGRFAIDSYVGPTPFGDIVERDGHWYTVVAPGCSLLLVPGVAIVRWIYPFLPAHWFASLPDRFLFFCQILLVPLMIAPGGALAAIFLRRILRAQGMNEPRAIWLAAMLPLGTHCFYYVSRMYAFSWVLALVLAGWQAGWKARNSADRRAAFVSGFLLAGAYMLDYSALWVMVVAFLLVGLKRSPFFIAGALLPLGATFLYHAVAHGHPLRTGYNYFVEATPETIPLSRAWLSAYEGKDFAEAAWGLTFGMRGLVYVFPSVILLPWALGRIGNSASRWAAAVFALLFCFALTLRHGLWVGGTSWGPRILVLACPFLIMALAPAFARLEKKSFAGIIGLSIFINWLGAQLGAGFSVIEHTAYFLLSGPTTPVFRWLVANYDSIILKEHLGDMAPNYTAHYWGFTQLSPVGAYVFLALLVAWILWPGGRLSDCAPERAIDDTLS